MLQQCLADRQTACKVPQRTHYQLATSDEAHIDPAKATLNLLPKDVSQVLRGEALRHRSILEIDAAARDILYIVIGVLEDLHVYLLISMLILSISNP